jgi:hypothetical protein
MERAVFAAVASAKEALCLSARPTRGGRPGMAPRELAAEPGPCESAAEGAILRPCCPCVAPCCVCEGEEAPERSVPGRFSGPSRAPPRECVLPGESGALLPPPPTAGLCGTEW